MWEITNTKYRSAYFKFGGRTYRGIMLKLICGQSDTVIHMDEKRETEESFIIGNESVESKALWNIK